MFFFPHRVGFRRVGLCTGYDFGIRTSVSAGGAGSKFGFQGSEGAGYDFGVCSLIALSEDAGYDLGG